MQRKSTVQVSMSFTRSSDADVARAMTEYEKEVSRKLDQKIAEDTQKLAQLEADIKDIRANREQIQKAHAHVLERLAQSQAEVEELNRRIAQSEKNIAEGRASIAESKNSIAESKNSIAESKNSIAESKASIMDSKLKLAQINADIAKIDARSSDAGKAVTQPLQDMLTNVARALKVTPSPVDAHLDKLTHQLKQANAATAKLTLIIKELTLLCEQPRREISLISLRKNEADALMKELMVLVSDLKRDALHPFTASFTEIKHYIDTHQRPTTELDAKTWDALLAGFEKTKAAAGKDTERKIKLRSEIQQVVEALATLTPAYQKAILLVNKTQPSTSAPITIPASDKSRLFSTSCIPSAPSTLSSTSKISPPRG